MALICNIFGGPGVGKSTTAARIFVGLKDLGINTELATEFAKDKSWEGAHSTLACQPYITGTQIWRIERLAQAGVGLRLPPGELRRRLGPVAGPTRVVAGRPHAAGLRGRPGSGARVRDRR